MSEKIRWGIIGTGFIARKFAEALRSLPEAALAAVGSRTEASARSFAEEYGVARAYVSYADLAQDPEVDIVYIATPHPMHRDNTILCLRAGKHVLCEKPMAVNARDAGDMARVAREEQRFLMEAMWTRFLPAVAQAKRWVDEGAIGNVRQVRADFGFATDAEETHRLLNPMLAGGSLLDVGVYPIALAFWMFGAAPEAVTGLASLTEGKVDAQSAYVLRFPGDGLAWLSSAVRLNTPQDAVIVGERGTVRIPSPFWCATESVLERDGAAPETCRVPHPCNGYEYEAQHVMACLRAGKLESPVMPLDETCAILGVCDALRKQWGVVYPYET